MCVCGGCLILGATEITSCALRASSRKPDAPFGVSVRDLQDYPRTGRASTALHLQTSRGKDCSPDAAALTDVNDHKTRRTRSSIGPYPHRSWMSRINTFKTLPQHSTSTRPEIVGLFLRSKTVPGEIVSNL